MGPAVKRRNLLALLVAWPVLAGTGAVLAQSPTSHYWYDGATRRALWLDGSTIADFGSGHGRRDQVLKRAPGTQVKQLSTRRADGASDQSGTVAGSTGSKLSPLFRDAATGDGTERALPGGVIVGLPQAMDEPAARAWLASQGLTPVRPIGGTGLWLIDAPAGVASLDLANRLFESGKFSRATPDWWRPRALK